MFPQFRQDESPLSPQNRGDQNRAPANAGRENFPVEAGEDVYLLPEASVPPEAVPAPEERVSQPSVAGMLAELAARSDGPGPDKASDDASTVTPTAPIADGQQETEPVYEGALRTGSEPKAGALEEEDADSAFDLELDLPAALTSRQGNRRLKGRRLAPPKDQAGSPGKHASFTAEQRLLLLDTWLRSGLPAKDFAGLVGISKHTLYKWKQLFEEQGPAGLTEQPGGAPSGSRLPEVTKRTILMLKQQHPEWGCERISDMLVAGPKNFVDCALRAC